MRRHKIRVLSGLLSLLAAVCWTLPAAAKDFLYVPSVNTLQVIDCDFLVCSAYKFFGPHIGVMYAKKDLLKKLKPLNLRTQKQCPPYMFETGTLNHEGIAGAKAAVEFIADVGLKFGNITDGLQKDLRTQIVSGLKMFDSYEQDLCKYVIETLSSNPNLTLYGPPPGYPRTSTISFTCEGANPSPDQTR